MLKNNWQLFWLRKLYASLWKLVTLLETIIKTKKINRILEFNQLQWLKVYIEFITHKKEAEKGREKNEKVLYKLMEIAIYEKKWKIWEIELI